MNDSASLLRGRRVLVIGGTGYIGRRLGERCAASGARVVATGRTGSFATFEANTIEYARMDVTDPASVRAVLDGRVFEYVFFLGTYVDHAPYSAGGRAQIDVGFRGLMHVIDALDRSALARLVYVGSSDEYGGLPAPQREEMREEPISPYAFAKTAATHLLQMLSRRDELRSSVARLFLVYGPGQPEKRFLPQVMGACLRGEAFPTSGGEQLRDFCYIDDAVEGLVRMAVTPAAEGQVVNIASGQPQRIRESIERVMTLAGGGTPQWGAYPYRPGENMALYADVTRARTLLDWQAKVSFEEGLERTLDDCRRRKQS